MQKSLLKKSFIIATIAGIVLGGSWYYLTQTARGGSYALYVAAAWGTPIGIKFDCAKETDKRVDQKFQLPFNVDQDVKDALKGFWYYSYYRQCLYDAGYNFSGDKIQPSSITPDTPDALYTNPLGGFSFRIPEGTTIVSDNKLNVDFDDRLFVSSLETSSETISIHVYVTYRDIKTVEDITKIIKQIPGTVGSITGTIFEKSNSGVDIVYMKQDDDMQGVAFVTPQGHVVFVAGSNLLEPIIKTVADTLSSTNL